jgi:hypothetical protein
MDEAPFIELIAGLRTHGRGGDADALESLKVVGWTSSAEMVGELGQAVLELEPELPAELKPLAARCLRAVHTVWPHIGRRKTGR